MRAGINVFSSAVAATALVTGLTACDTHITDPVVLPGGAITTFVAPTNSGCPQAHRGTVLIDPTHDGGTWWYPQGGSKPEDFNSADPHQGKALADYLRARGFTVTELGRGATMTQDSLLTYSMVIRAGYYYNAEHPGYSADDITAYRKFTGCARTLLLLADYLTNGRHDDLADSLGIPLVGQRSGTISTFTAHPITTGVTSIPFIAGSFLENESNHAIQVLGRLGTGEAVMGLLNGRNARVFFMGDINGIEHLPQPFVDNLITWGTI